eukprot:GHVH01015500.1.p1 GENE.GHVH01015500.1~~GHVH01015500.1.p1  ORF type:complete len:242 (+),score=17.73 GHVH01015500.1:329-1054(+)
MVSLEAQCVCGCRIHILIREMLYRGNKLSHLEKALEKWMADHKQLREDPSRSWGIDQMAEALTSLSSTGSSKVAAIAALPRCFQAVEPLDDYCQRFASVFASQSFYGNAFASVLFVANLNPKSTYDFEAKRNLLPEGDSRLPKTLLLNETMEKTKAIAAKCSPWPDRDERAHRTAAKINAFQQNSKKRPRDAEFSNKKLPQGDRSCFNCRKPGHVAAECNMDCTRCKKLGRKIPRKECKGH